MPETPVTVSEADITDELEKGGPALGAFLKATGLAVAESQKELDAVFSDTVKVLSNTQVDVIAVFEQVVNDDGSMGEGNVKIQKLPLINYVMPVNYAYSRVYLEANMKVREFNAAKGLNIQGKATRVRFGSSVKASFLGVRGGTSLSVGHSEFDRDRQLSTATDEAAGDLHLEATLEPRDDTQLPSPIVLQKGPKLAVRMTSRGEVTGPAGAPGDPPPPAVGRQAVFEVSLKKTDGANHSGQDLNLDVSDPMVEMEAQSTTTDASGKILVTLKRQWGTLGEGETPPSPSEVVLRVTFGVVTSSGSVIL